MSKRLCRSCKISRTRLLGDGTFASLDRAKYDRYFSNLKKRRALHGKHYDLIDGVLTAGLLEQVRDVITGRVCRGCYAPFQSKVASPVALQTI